MITQKTAPATIKFPAATDSSERRTHQLARERLEQLGATALRIAKEVPGASVVVRDYSAESSCEVVIQRPEYLGTIRVESTAGTISKMDAPDYTLLPGPTESTDWPQWHALLETRRRRPLTRNEQADFDRLRQVVGALDERELAAGTDRMEALAHRHQETLASIKALTQAVLALARCEATQGVSRREIRKK